MDTRSTEDNVARYAQADDDRLTRDERRLIDELFQPGMTVLELGCGRGRLTRPVIRRGVRLTAVDLDPAALDALRVATGGASGISILQADACELPFVDESFDAVLFGFNGLDFLYPRHQRVRALSEVARVLRPGGRFVFSSHNPVGILLSLRTLRSARLLLWRLRYALTGAFLHTYYCDPAGLLLHQARPSAVIREVHDSTSLIFECAFGRSGRPASLRRLELACNWPYYVFHK